MNPFQEVKNILKTSQHMCVVQTTHIHWSILHAACQKRVACV